jgi:hypothetical protein
LNFLSRIAHRAQKLRAAMDKRHTLHQLLSSYVQVFMIQTSQTP